MLIPVNGLIALFKRMYDEHWAYKWGAAQQGNVDCSGAFVWAYKRFGKTIAHGSNTIARANVVELLPVSKAEPGMAAFKVRVWRESDSGNRWYKQPPGDCYHIGLVDETGKYVYNAQSEKAGFTKTAISKWGYVGYLNAVDYEDQTPAPAPEVPASIGIAHVVGGRLNVREKPGGAKITQLPEGTEVDVLETDGEWSRIEYAATGWVKDEYLARG